MLTTNMTCNSDESACDTCDTHRVDVGHGLHRAFGPAPAVAWRNSELSAEAGGCTAHHPMKFNEFADVWLGAVRSLR